MEDNLLRSLNNIDLNLQAVSSRVFIPATSDISDEFDPVLVPSFLAETYFVFAVSLPTLLQAGKMLSNSVVIN